MTRDVVLWNGRTASVIVGSTKDDDTKAGPAMKVCRECGTYEDVHRGLCRKCRERGRGAARGSVEQDRRLEHPVVQDLEPQHDQPWVPRSALADRIRRSPRR